MTRQNLSKLSDQNPAQRHGRPHRLGARPMARLRHSKGFTLVELMVVIVIVGILSAVALPKFLGVKDKAKLNTQLGEAAGLAKECSAAIIAEGTYPADYASTTTNTGLTISGNCNGGTTATAPTAGNDITYTTTVANGNEGAKCGTDPLTDGQQCVVTVSADTGNITYAPST